MQGTCWKGLVGAGILLTGCLARSDAAPPSPLAKYKEAAVAIAVGSVEGLELASKVIEQKAQAQANLKKLFGADKVPHQETEHLLLYGKVPGKSLKEVGVLLEKQFVLARKTLRLEEDPPWPGKLTVYFFADRGKLTSFIRLVEKRRPESDDLGSYNIRSEAPHVAAGPPKESHDPGLEAQAAEQLAAALVVKRAGTTVPEWVVVGFARATYYRAAGPREYLGEKSRARRVLAAGRATAMDVWDSNLKADSAPVLRGSLVDFLAYGPGRSKFLAFLEGYKPEEGKLNKTTADALQAANIDPKVVNRKWKVWVRK
jgi:hypothetical protein